MIHPLIATMFQIEYQIKMTVNNTHIILDDTDIATFIYFPQITKDLASDDILDEQYE